MDNLTGLSLRDFLGHVRVRDKDGREKPREPSAVQKRLFALLEEEWSKGSIRLIILKTTPPPDYPLMLHELWETIA